MKAVLTIPLLTLALSACTTPAPVYQASAVSPLSAEPKAWVDPGQSAPPAGSLTSMGDGLLLEPKGTNWADVCWQVGRFGVLVYEFRQQGGARIDLSIDELSLAPPVQALLYRIELMAYDVPLTTPLATTHRLGETICHTYLAYLAEQGVL